MSAVERGIVLDAETAAVVLDLVADSLTGFMAERLVTTHSMDRATVALLLGGGR